MVLVVAARGQGLPVAAWRAHCDTFVDQNPS
jgi:hypothetical protein